MDQPSTSPKVRARGFSFRSDKSAGSGNKQRADDVESPQEKARRDSIWKNSSKANPNAALNEAQPGGTLQSSLTLLPYLPPFFLASPPALLYREHVYTPRKRKEHPD